MGGEGVRAAGHFCPGPCCFSRQACSLQLIRCSSSYRVYHGLGPLDNDLAWCPLSWGVAHLVLGCWFGSGLGVCVMMAGWCQVMVSYRVLPVCAGVLLWLALVLSYPRSFTGLTLYYLISAIEVFFHALLEHKKRFIPPRDCSKKCFLSPLTAVQPSHILFGPLQCLKNHNLIKSKAILTFQTVFVNYNIQKKWEKLKNTSFIFVGHCN